MVYSGTFCRWESTTQTARIAVIQVRTGEIWGKTPRGGLYPTVQAYPGGLGGRRGIEFVTGIAPHSMSAPHEARWYYPLTPGVELRQSGGQDFACIKASVTNYQP